MISDSSLVWVVVVADVVVLEVVSFSQERQPEESSESQFDAVVQVVDLQFE